MNKRKNKINNKKKEECQIVIFYFAQCIRRLRYYSDVMQIKDKIKARLEVYKKVVNGQEDLWGEYCRLREEVK